MNKKIFFIVAASLILIVGIISTILLLSKKPSIKGKVVSARYDLSRTSFGQYQIVVLDKSGKSFTINATGNGKVPGPTKITGKDCVLVPRLNSGKEVEFYLPESQAPKGTFDICYADTQAGYFFKTY
jgi:hypothetical protein